MTLRTVSVNAVVCLVLAACGGGTGGGRVQVAASAQLDGAAPFTVEATEPSQMPDGGAEHEVVFTVEDDRTVVIDDVRWTFGELTDGGAFTTAGHGCSADIQRLEGRGQVVHSCTEEFRILTVRPGEPLRETITVNGALGRSPAAEGTFTFEQPLRWWYADATEGGADEPVEPPAGDPDGEATVRLTYEVTRGG